METRVSFQVRVIAWEEGARKNVIGGRCEAQNVKCEIEVGGVRYRTWDGEGTKRKVQYARYRW